MPRNAKCSDFTRLTNRNTGETRTVAEWAALQASPLLAISDFRRLASSLAPHGTGMLNGVRYERRASRQVADPPTHEERFDALEARIAKLEQRANLDAMTVTVAGNKP